MQKKLWQNRIRDDHAILENTSYSSLKISSTKIQGWNHAAYTHCFSWTMRDRSWSEKSGAEKPDFSCLDISENRGEIIKNFCSLQYGINQPVTSFSCTKPILCNFPPFSHVYYFAKKEPVSLLKLTKP